MARPIQVYLGDLDLERLDTFAKRHGWTKSHAVREAIRLAARNDGDDPLLDLVGLFDGPRDLSTNHDHYLNEAFIADKQAKPQARRRRSRATVRR
jgi:hypothetical protein